LSLSNQIQPQYGRGSFLCQKLLNSNSGVRFAILQKMSISPQVSDLVFASTRIHFPTSNVILNDSINPMLFDLKRSSEIMIRLYYWRVWQWYRLWKFDVFVKLAAAWTMDRVNIAEQFSIHLNTTENTKRKLCNNLNSSFLPIKLTDLEYTLLSKLSSQIFNQIQIQIQK